MLESRWYHRDSFPMLIQLPYDTPVVVFPPGGFLPFNLPFGSVFALNCEGLGSSAIARRVRWFGRAPTGPQSQMWNLLPNSGLSVILDGEVVQQQQLDPFEDGWDFLMLFEDQSSRASRVRFTLTAI